MEETGSELCAMAGFRIGNVETLDSATKAFISSKL